MNIDQVLQENSFEVKQLLRRSRIVGEPSIENIRRGFEKSGEPFMMKLLQIITPTEASFTDLITPKSAVLSSGVNTKTLAPMQTATQSATAENTGAWSFWEKLLNGVGATGEAIGKFKNDINAAPEQTVETTQQQAQQAQNSKLLYYIAAGFAALILLILIFRK